MGLIIAVGDIDGQCAIQDDSTGNTQNLKKTLMLEEMIKLASLIDKLMKGFMVFQ
jgi:hypothetical protein